MINKTSFGCSQTPVQFGGIGKSLAKNSLYKAATLVGGLATGYLVAKHGIHADAETAGELALGLNTFRTGAKGFGYTRLADTVELRKNKAAAGAQSFVDRKIENHAAKKSGSGDVPSGGSGPSRPSGHDADDDIYGEYTPKGRDNGWGD